MNFLDYANKNQINIIPKKEFSDLTLQVFRTVSDNLARSLGPLGSNAIIFDRRFSETTKDGYSILSRIRFTNIYKTMILDMIKRICTRMNNTVGDGTTTAIVLASAMYTIYKDQESEISSLYRLPREFISAWDDVVSKIRGGVIARQRPLQLSDGDITEDDVYNIAYVTSNGNETVSEEIARLYRETPDPFITLKNSPTDSSFIKKINGFQFQARFISEGYPTRDDGSSVYDDPLVMVFGFTVDAMTWDRLIHPLVKNAWAARRQLIILAPAFDKSLCDTKLLRNYHEEIGKYQNLFMIPCQYRSGAIGPNDLTDLVAVLDCLVINEEIFNALAPVAEKNSDDIWENMENPSDEYYDYFGKCKRATISMEDGAQFEIVEKCPRHVAAIESARNDLENVLAKSSYEGQNVSLKSGEARQRLSRLEMNSYLYFVGASSELQQIILNDSIDDVVKCLRSASKYGVVPGCQISIINTCTDLLGTDLDPLETAIVRIILGAVVQVYRQIIMGPDGDGAYKLMAIPPIDEGETIEAYVERLIRRFYSDEKMANDKVVSLARGTLSDGQSEDDSVWVTRVITNIMVDLVNNLIANSCRENKTFDLEIADYNEKLITSAETDIGVLMAASDLIKILISGNQCVYISPALNPEHEEEIDVYGQNK